MKLYMLHIGETNVRRKEANFIFYWVEKKELILYHKLKFFSPYIFVTVDILNL